MWLWTGAHTEPAVSAPAVAWTSSPQGARRGEGASRREAIILPEPLPEASGLRPQVGRVWAQGFAHQGSHQAEPTSETFPWTSVPTA